MSDLSKFTGQVQSTREIQATRIEDEMFIFTGTYPLIYKGDGNLYMMPDYRTSFTEISQSGHNIMSSNFEEIYRYDEYSELETNPNQLNADSFDIVDDDFAPVIPYRLDASGEPITNPFNIKLAYSLPPEYGEETNSFLPENFRGTYETLNDAKLNVENFQTNDVVFITNQNIQLPEQSFYQVDKEGDQDWLFFGTSSTLAPDLYNNFQTTQGDIEPFLDPELTEADYSVFVGEDAPGAEPIIYTQIYDSGTLLNTDYEVKVTPTKDQIIVVTDTTPNGASFFALGTDGTTYSTNFTSKYVRIVFNISFKKVTPNEIGIKPLYELYPVVYSRFPTPGAPWEEVSFRDYNRSLYSNASEDFNPKDVNDRTLSVVPKTGSLSSTTDGVEINFKTLSAEMKDYKVELRIRKRAYETAIKEVVGDGGITSVSYLSTEFVDEFVESVEYIIEDLQPTAFKLEDYPNEENPDREFSLNAIWSANKVLEHYNKLMVYGSEEMPHTLFVSFPDNPSYFPAGFSIDFNTDSSEAIQSVVPFTQILVVQSENRTWGLKGNSSPVFLDPEELVPNESRYTVFDINTSIGTIAPNTVKPVRNRLFFLSNEGVAALVSLYATDNRYNVKLMDRNIENIVPREENAIAIQHDNQYWLAFPGSKQIFRYYIDKEAWVRDDFNHFNDFGGIHKFYRNEGELRFISRPTLVKDTDNEYKMYEAYIDKSLPTDFGLNVPSEFLTADLDQLMPFHEKRFKELKFDFVIQNEYLPDLTAQPVENVITDYDAGTYSYIFEADLEKNHSYKVAFPFGVYEGSEPEEFDFYDLNRKISNLQVYINDEPAEFVGLDTGDIYFTLGNESTSIENSDTIKVQFDSQEDFSSQWENIQSAIVDFTYDLNIRSFVIAKSDGVFMNREAMENYVPGVENLYDLVRLERSLGTRFSNFTFDQTPFGDVAKSVKTVRLAGSGYGITVYMKDDSRSKWTMETLGVAYRIRKPRSRT